MTKLSICMIVKDEETYLPESLESVKTIAEEIIVVDTGSVDNSVGIAKMYGAHVFPFQWNNDFSAARNFAISKCTGDFILFLDADEKVTSASCNEITSHIQIKQKTAFYCDIYKNDYRIGRKFIKRTPRLVANNEAIKFTGRVNEQIDSSLHDNGYSIIPSRIQIKHIGYEAADVTIKKRINRYLPILVEEYELHKSPSIAFAIAVACETIKEEVQATHYFKIVADSTKLDRTLRGYAYTTLAFYSHQERMIQESEKNINFSLKLCERQPFGHLLSSRISLRKNEFNLAEEKCKRAYILNQDFLARSQDSQFAVTVYQEEILYFGITLSLKNRNTPNYQFYQKELIMYYKSIDERDNQNRSDVIKKIFLSIPINDDEVQVLIKMINKNSLSFFIYMLGSYPNKKQLIVILQSILKQFPNILEAQKLLAKILDEHGRVDDAVRVMERIIEVDQSDVTIFFYLISYYLKQGQESKIKPVIEKIEKNFSHLPDVMSRVRTLRRKLLTFTTVPL